MTQLYICAHCGKEATPPLLKDTYSVVVHCPHCMRMTNAERARQLGAKRQEAAALAERIKTAACPRCASKPCACDIQKAGLCEDEGCTNAGTPHVCITKTDCRSEEGITVGLIDTIINSARLLKGRSWNSTAILEALKDLRTDEDLGALTGVFEDAEIIAKQDRQTAELKAELQGAKQLLKVVLESGLLKRGASMTERVRDFLTTGYKETLKQAPVGPTTYSDFVDIESRNDVQEALENFSHDSTRDNAVELIKIIYEATKPKC